MGKLLAILVGAMWLALMWGNQPTEVRHIFTHELKGMTLSQRR